MKYAIGSIVLAALVLIVLATGGPVQSAGSCPDGFHRHHVSDRDDHEGQLHTHLGIPVDQNGDGFICVRHLAGVHLHIDNTF